MALMTNKFGIDIEKLNPGRRVSLALDETMFREEATVDGVLSGRSIVSIYVRRDDDTRARVGFDQVAEILRRKG